MQVDVLRCYCGDSLAMSARKELDSVCRHVCISDFSQICGGRNSLSMYEVDTEATASTTWNPTSAAIDIQQNQTVPATDETGDSTVSGISPSAPTPGPLIAPASPPQIVKIPHWTYRGCWTDSTTQRTLAGKKWQGSLLTVQRCAIICRGYRYFGVENSTE